MLNEVRRIIDESDVIVVMAGAGMSSDSIGPDGENLPTFRGNKGFWRAYPKLKNKINFAKLCTPSALEKDPKMAWALYGHMFDLFNDTDPHEGFHTLLEMISKKEDYFVVTSNIDSHFQKAGYDPKKVYEIHGRINKFQCTHCDYVWTPNKTTRFNVDPELMELNETPMCPLCGALARPNIMMFNDSKMIGDHGFDNTETEIQAGRFNNFMNKYDKGKHKIALVEIGCGEGVPTIRIMGEFIQEQVVGATLIRINPTDIEGPTEFIPVKMTALDAINQLC